MEKKKLQFPKGFLWGTATSSHQIEGGNLNNWSEWEKKNAQRLAQEAAKKYDWLPNWPQIKKEAQDTDNYISSRSCDHYNLYEQDFNLVKELNQNVHRFSLEWSRLEPEEGCFSQSEFEHYKKVLLSLKKRNIKPFVTLWHWTNPLWITKRGGWLDKKTPQYFERYVKEVMKNLGQLADFWITINEPLIFAKQFLDQDSPGRVKNFSSVVLVIKNLVTAHKKAYQVIHQSSKKKVGISKNCIYFEGWPIDKLAGYFWNHYFLKKIKNHQDFIGLNYYHHHRFGGNENKEISDLGWEIYPQGIYRVLLELKQYKQPIYITENGLADAQDSKRTKFIIEHLKWVYQAMQEGVDVRGYFYWSLLDNFEWNKGFWPRFGLIEVDFETLERKIRPSAYLFAHICQSNCLIVNKE